MSDSPDGPRRLALLVATSTYDDPGLGHLVSPAQDATALAAVLAAAAIGDFEVSAVEDGIAAEICGRIEDFATESDRGDLVLLYLSCHGLKDEQGRLYFAARNTRRDRLRSTAVPAAFVNDVLFNCRSRRKVLLLDCCYSGAFAKGLSVKSDLAVHTADHFDARGLVVVTASDATQYAFEGEAVSGLAAPSVFTTSLVEGLRSGAADVDGDGLVSVDDAYEYARRRLSEQARPQSPRKWAFDVAGSIVLARTPQAPGGPRLGTVPAVVPVVSTGPSREERVPASGAARRQWWLGVLVLLVASVGSSVLLVLALDAQLHGTVVPYDYLPGRRSLLVAAGAGAAAWTLAYALDVAPRPTPTHWYDLLLRCARAWGDLVEPGTLGDHLRAARAAVPLNVTATVLLSGGAGALGWRWSASGSAGRDLTFRLTYVVLIVVAVVSHVVHGRRLRVREQRGRAGSTGS